MRLVCTWCKITCLALHAYTVCSVLLTDKWQHSHVGRHKWRFLLKKDPVVKGDLKQCIKLFQEQISELLLATRFYFIVITVCQQLYNFKGETFEAVLLLYPQL